MALQLSHTTAGDITATSAYHRITWFCGGSATDQMEIELSIYKDATARQDKQRIDQKRVRVAVDLAATGNVLADLYVAVKALPEYAGASDV